jgi:YndJ-like protein
VTKAFSVLLGDLTLVDLLLLLAPLVIVPLGLRLLPFSGGRSRQVLAVARLVQPIGAIAAVVSFLVPTGWAAGVIASGWLMACAIVSLAGLVELIEQRSLMPVRLVPAAASAYLSVGAVWLVVSRAGVRPLGFAPAIVELTGVHFHYAGFAATLLAALAIAVLRERGRLAQWASAGGLLVTAGVAITAGGIATGSGLLTVVGPIVLAIGVLSIAALTALAIAPGIEPSLARWLLWISAAGVVLPMFPRRRLRAGSRLSDPGARPSHHGADPWRPQRGGVQPRRAGWLVGWSVARLDWTVSPRAEKQERPRPLAGRRFEQTLEE